MSAINMMRASVVLDWAQAARLGPAVAGGKGAQLGRLARYGLPVGDGCVIAADACRAMMNGHVHEAALRACAAAESGQNDQLEKLRQTISVQALPAALSDELGQLLDSKGWHNVPLAIRSSAPSEDSAQASFAGIHHSVLNVIGRAALNDAIRVVWASLWTPQAVAYRERIGLQHESAAMAVVIMPLIAAKASGVAFTCDPRSGREDRLVISSVRGLGEALVSGLVSGEDIVLGSRQLDNTWSVVERRSGSATQALEPDAAGGVSRRDLTQQEMTMPVLDDAQAAALAVLAWDAANALDFSAPWYDIEWVWDGAKFHLVQARPITARPRHTYPGLQRQASIWSTGNSRDVLPHVCDASSLHLLKVGVNALLQTVYRVAGVPLLAGAQRFALIQGRAYFNVSLIQWEAYDGFGAAPSVVNRTMGGHQPEISVPARTLRQKLTHIVRKLRLIAKARAMRRQGLAESRRVFAEAKEWRKTNLSALADDALLEQCDDLRANVFHGHTGMMFMQMFSGMSIELLKFLDRKFPGEGNALASALMAGGTPSVTAQQGHDLLHLASLARNEAHTLQWLCDGHQGDWRLLPAGSAFRAAFTDFLERYGHRGVYESYPRTPRWREDPSYLLASVAGLLDADRQEIPRRQQQAVASAWLRIAGGTSRFERYLIRILLRVVKRDDAQRELARSSFTAIGERGRMMGLEIARRLVTRGVLNQRDQVFHLTGAEHAGALRGELRHEAIQARIADRVKLAEHWERQPVHDVVIEGADGVPVVPAPELDAVNESDSWRGVAVGSGYAQGKVCIVRHPNEQARLQRGDILVAPSTDPSWVPLFLKAGGLIMETGGYVSHGAIVAREFGIPAVVNLPGIMDQLRDGEMVAVDGQRGLVVRLAAAESDSPALGATCRGAHSS